MKTSNRQLGGGSSGMHSDRRVSLESVRFDRLETHPLSVKVYGEPDPSPELINSLEKHGMLQPIVVNYYEDGSYHLVSGNTRVKAWGILYSQGRVRSAWIPARAFHLEEIEVEQLVIESNRQREKTSGQKAREVAELFRIEKIISAKRHKIIEGQPSGKTTKIVASKVGQSHQKTEKQVFIVNQVEVGNQAAIDALRYLDSNKISVSAAYRMIRPSQPFGQTPLGGHVSNLERTLRKIKNSFLSSSKDDILSAKKRIKDAFDSYLTEI